MTTPHPPGKTGLRRFIGPKRIMVLIVLAVLVGVAWYLRQQGWLDPSAIQHLIEQYPVTAPIVFAAIYAIAMLSALPTLPVNLAAGLFWGLWLGAEGQAIKVFFCACVVVAGVFGALTANRKIFWVQGLPGVIALVLTLL